MDKQVLDELRKMILTGMPTPHTDQPTVYMPDNMGLLGFERYMDNPYRHEGQFRTSRVEAFNAYVNEHRKSETQVFIDREDMSAYAIIDHYDIETDTPFWKKHTALIKMAPTPEWTALDTNDKPRGSTFTQRGFLDFITDHQHCIKFLSDSDETEMNVSNAYQAIQRLEVSKSDASIHEEGDYKKTLSTLEEVEVTSTSQSALPTTMVMTCPTHIGLPDAVICCRLMVLANDKAVRLAYRINAKDAIIDRSAENFSDMIKRGLPDTRLWMGSFSNR